MSVLGVISKRLFLLTASLFIAIFTLILFFTSAQAHLTQLLKSEPSAGSVWDTTPSEVRLWFSEELQTGLSTVQVVDKVGKQVDNRDGGVDLDDPDHAMMVATLPPLPDGGYTVRWHALLLDGDATDGQFSFFIGEAGRAAATNESSLPAATQPAVSQSQTLFDAPYVSLLLVVIPLVIIGGIVFLFIRRKVA
jgi:methionine-rich copper-binding protein CopC